MPTQIQPQGTRTASGNTLRRHTSRWRTFAIAQATECVLTLGPRSFRLTWFTVMLFHSTCAVYHFWVVRLGFYMLLPNQLEFLDYLGKDLHRYFPALIAANAIFSAMHAYAIIGALHASFRAKQFAFSYSSQLLNTQNNNVPHRASKTRTRLVSVNRLLRRGWVVFFGRRGIFGMESPYFAEVFFFRELLEISLQTYQAFKLSSLVSTIWINRLFTVVISLNCWSMPIIHYLLRYFRPRFQDSQQYDSMAKLTSLLLDMALDLTSSICIPLGIFVGYVQLFEPDRGDFPFINYYDDTWFIRAVADNQQVFVLSWLDFISKVVPSLTLLGTMRSIKATFRRQDDNQITLAKSQGSLQQITVTTTPTHSIHPTLQLSSRRKWKIIHTIFGAWGFLVFGIHLQCTTIAVMNEASDCLLEIRPWFSTNYNCIVLEINCLKLPGGIGQGSAHEMEPYLIHLADQNLRGLIFSCCPALEIPKRIQRYHNLQVLKIYNSSVRSWSIEAALREENHPNIQFLYMVETNFTELPIGLSSQDFPASLRDIEFCGTNLTELPPNLHNIWGRGSYMDFVVYENVIGMTEVPSTLLEMNVRHMSLCATGLREIPTRLLSGNSTIMSLAVASNPLSSLPDHRDAAEPRPLGLHELTISRTNISELPTWLLNAADLDGAPTNVIADSTPLCDHLNIHPVDQRDVMLTPSVQVSCPPPSPEPIHVLYVLAFERELRQRTLRA